MKVYTTFILTSSVLVHTRSVYHRTILPLHSQRRADPVIGLALFMDWGLTLDLESFFDSDVPDSKKGLGKSVSPRPARPGKGRKSPELPEGSNHDDHDAHGPYSPPSGPQPSPGLN